MIKNINLDEQTFDSIVEYSRKSIRKYAPSWTDENLHDPGITLIELFAWLVEMLEYYMDQTTEPLAYEFLERYGIKRNYGKPATVLAEVSNLQETTNFPMRTQFKKGNFIFETGEDFTISPYKILDLRFEKDGILKSIYEILKSGLSIYPFGKKPGVGDKFYIEFDSCVCENKEFDLYFKIYDDYKVKRNPIRDKSNFYPLGKINWYYKSENKEWKLIEGVIDDTFGFIQSGIIKFPVLENMKNLNDNLSLMGQLVEVNYDVIPRIEKIFTQVIKLKQIDSSFYYENLKTVYRDEIYLNSGNCIYQKEVGKNKWRDIKEDFYFPKESKFRKILYREEPMIFNSNGLPNQKFDLNLNDIYYSSIELQVLETSDDGSLVWVDWKMVDHILKCDKDERRFFIDEKTNHLCFGNGQNGAIPEKGQDRIRIISLSRSMLEKGNIKVETLLNEDLKIKLNGITFGNGGKNIPSIEDLKDQLYYKINKQNVAVSAYDYETILKNSQGLMIEKIKCLPLYRLGLKDYPKETAENEVSVLVIPFSQEGKGQLNKGYIENLKRDINKKRLLSTDVHILNPVYYEIDLSCEVNSLNTKDKIIDEIRNNVLKTLAYDFGENISKSILYKKIIALDSVLNVHSLRLSSSQILSKNKQGDIEIPPNCIGTIKNIEVFIVSE